MEDHNTIKELLTLTTGAGGGGFIVVLAFYLWGKFEEWKKQKAKELDEHQEKSDDKMHETHMELFRRVNAIEISLPQFVKKIDLDSTKDTIISKLDTVFRDIRSELQGLVKKEDLGDKIEVVVSKAINLHSTNCINRKV